MTLRDDASTSSASPQGDRGLADLPAGRFGCILADPPWSFRTWAADGVPQRAAEPHYSTMDLAALKALPVERLAAPDCLLMMWVVGALLPQALELGAAWGFAFKSDGLWWVKQRLRDADQVDMFTDDIPPPVRGLGYWLRKGGEMSLIFTRGNPARLSKGVPAVIVEPRREHSRKPDCQYDRIEALVGGPYLELFARQQRPGWTAWGNQVDLFSPSDAGREASASLGYAAGAAAAVRPCDPPAAAREVAA